MVDFKKLLAESKARANKELEDAKRNSEQKPVGTAGAEAGPEKQGNNPATNNSNSGSGNTGVKFTFGKKADAGAVSVSDTGKKPASQAPVQKKEEKAGTGIKFTFGKKQDSASQSQVATVAQNRADTVQASNPAPGGDVGSAAASPPVISAAEYNHESQTDGLTEAAEKEFRDSLSVLHNSFDHKELVAQAIKNVLDTLKKYPQFRAVLAPEDVQLMVRSLRQSYGFVVAEKVEKKEKKATKEKKTSEVLDALGGMDFSV